MNSFNNETLLSKLAAELESNPAFMSYVLVQYCQIEGFDQDRLATDLGISPFLLARLGLCKRPDADSPNFVQAISEIADFVLVDEIKLAQIIREVDLLAALGNLVTEHQTGENAVFAPFSGGVLAAARDQIEEDGEEESKNDAQ